MRKKNFLIIVFVILNLKLFAQISPSITESKVKTFTEAAEQRVRGFYSDLDLIGDLDITNVERNIIISQVLNTLFGDQQVYVYNDVDLTDEQPEIVESDTYLNNIRLYFGNSDVSFEIDSLKLSDVYLAEDFYFIKAEVLRTMTVKLNNRLIRDTKNLDIYLKHVPNNIVDCRIYSLKPHEDNLGEFEKVNIKTDDPFGRLFVNSNPKGAIVTIKELPQYKTLTPDTLKNLKPGDYNVTLTKEGLIEKREVQIEPNKLRILNVAFSEQLLGSYRLNTQPDGASVAINNKVIPNVITPYTINNQEPGLYDINFSKKGYYDLQEQIKIEANKTGTLNVSLQKITTDAGKGQWIWLGGAIATAAAGGYFKLTADKSFKDYQESTDSDEAADLKKKVQNYDKLTIGSFGLAGICTVGFTISTVKKGKAKKSSAHVEMNGHGARLTYNF